MTNEMRRVNREDNEEVPSASQSQPGQEKKVCFDYIKSSCFRVIRVDGVHGGPTPRSDGVQIAFFSERAAIPTREEYPVMKDGTFGKPTVEQRDAVVREVEVEAILSVEMAKGLENWLHEKIEQIEKLRTKGV